MCERKIHGCRVPVCRLTAKAVHPICVSFALRGELLQVVVGVAELGINNQQPLEVVADPELLRHAHAAMQLHRILTDEGPQLAHHVLQSMDAALGCRAVALSGFR